MVCCHVTVGLEWRAQTGRRGGKHLAGEPNNEKHPGRGRPCRLAISPQSRMAPAARRRGGSTRRAQHAAPGWQE